MKTTLQLFDRKGRLKHSQHGMTLIEVLIAMFVLAIGVLALLSVQLRSVSGVREAESQTIVSQITQNLIEDMLVNPVLSAATDSSGNTTGGTIKSYDHYLTSGSSKVSGSYKNDGTAMSKAELATAQVASFSSELTSALPDTQVFFAICHDSLGTEPTYNGSFTSNCDGKANSDTVIKVLWLADAEEKQKSTNLKSSDNYIIYTHQSRVTE